MSGTPGMTKRAPIKPGQARARIWQSMRMLRQFTTADLVAAGEVGRSNAERYLRGLWLAAYVRKVQPRRSGHVGGDAVWRLVRDTGPYAPRIGKQGLRDPNLEPQQAQKMVTIPEPEYQRALRCIRLVETLRNVDALRERAAAVLEVVR